MRHPVLTPLEGARYLSLTTFRRDETPVSTPMWFAAQDDTVYAYTGERTGKMKRLRHNPLVTLAPCTVRGAVTGPAIVGAARVIDESREIQRASSALARKYGWQFQVFRAVSALAHRLQRNSGNAWCYLAITPHP